MWLARRDTRSMFASNFTRNRTFTTLEFEAFSSMVTATWSQLSVLVQHWCSLWSVMELACNTSRKPSSWKCRLQRGNAVVTADYISTVSLSKRQKTAWRWVVRQRTSGYKERTGLVPTTDGCIANQQSRSISVTALGSVFIQFNAFSEAVSLQPSI